MSKIENNEDKKSINHDKSAFVIAYLAVAISGYIMGLLSGWVIWS